MSSARIILAAGLVHASLFDAWINIVSDGDFDDGRERLLVQAVRACKQGGLPPDLVSVTDAMYKINTNGLFAKQSIDAYLEELAGECALVEPEHLKSHARRVHAQGEAKRRIERFQKLGEHAAKDDADAFLARVQRFVESERTDKPSKWLTASERASAVGGQTDQIATGFATLDEAVRGGLRTGKLVAFGGAPGAGKTTWAMQLAWRWALQGIHVAVLAADEDADGLLIRVGQACGFTREDLEAGNPSARAFFAQQLAKHDNFVLVDTDETGATLEEVSADLKRRAAGRPSVLIADSIQTARTAGSLEADGPRARIDAVVAALKRAAKVDGHLIIATCELARGAYRSQNAADRIDDLASFKESGGIEYGVTTAFVLRSVPTEEGIANGLVDVSMPKNRQGTKKAFRMKLDFARATFSEVELPPKAEQGGPSRIEQVKERIIDVIAKSVVPIKSRNEIVRRSKSTKKHGLVAIDEAIDEGRIAQLDGQFFLSKEEAKLRKNGHVKVTEVTHD
jgi:replicative DNA helicase